MPRWIHRELSADILYQGSVRVNICSTQTLLNRREVRHRMTIQVPIHRASVVLNANRVQSLHEIPDGHIRITLIRQDPDGLNPPVKVPERLSSRY